MKSPTTIRSSAVLCLCVTSVLWSACSALGLADDPDKTARLERFEPSALLLKVPEGVKGDFAVAKEAPALDFAVFPNQWEGARLWSAWGDSVCGSDGKFYASVGDHASPYGTSYVYCVDPQSKRVDLIVDYNAVVGMPKGKYAPGKIHAPLCDGGDGWLYMIGYRGSVGGTTKEADYEGDWMLRYHMESGKIENLGTAVPYSSAPSMEPYPPLGLLYGLGAPGKSMPEPKRKFFAYDYKNRKLVFAGGPECTMNRAIIVTREGRVYYETDGKLQRYDPKENKVTATQATVPGNGRLRAASTPDKGGVVYCFSSDGEMFSFDPKTEKVAQLGKAFVTGRLYIASCELSPGGRYLYYVPSAHGGSRVHGTALIQLDVKTKKRKVIAFLNELLRQKKGYNLGGTYALALSRDGSQLFVNWNGAPAAQKRNDFGQCSAMIVHIPEGERSEDE